MDNGIVRNWEDMEHVWDYTFNEKLKINPKECKVCTRTCAVQPHHNPVSPPGLYGLLALEPSSRARAAGKRTTSAHWHNVPIIYTGAQAFIKHHTSCTSGTDLWGAAAG